MNDEVVRYTFQFEDRKVVFDTDTKPHQNRVGPDYPEWTRMSYRQCSCCPVKACKEDRCPVATRISAVLEAFASNQSTERVKVTVETAQRNYYQECDLQVGLNSLLGILMATSACPVLERLGAMANFHIPFCSTRETLHRTVGSYLMQQYFKQLRGEEPDWELKELKELYTELEGLNRDFSKRIEGSIQSDAVSNAVIMFFATSVVVASSLDQQLQKHEKYLTNAM
ncbi:DUF6901 family protein [Coraliomargarita parva]|uniref:DUF6901 family protein n=1 Tax=Coraliomargarita parva TaxID=3014050 RepID=UPI0022B5A634|nr:hypothetical protein [Coraliomargarita parva]